MAQEKGYRSEKGFLSDRAGENVQHVEAEERPGVAHDFFGNPTNGGAVVAPNHGTRPDSPSNGQGREREPLPVESELEATPVAARDPWTRLVLTLILLGLVGYGAYAHRQWNAILRALVELKLAPRAVETSPSAIELADMSLGGPGGKLAELSVDDKSGAATILLNFFNSGHTAARHFAVVAWTNARPGMPNLEYRQRFRNSGTGEVSARGLSAFQATVAAGSPYTVAVPDEWMPSAEWLREARANSSRLFVVSGAFEYCDVLGNYRCGKFAIRYLAPPADRFASWLTTSCRPLAPTPPDAVNSRWSQLERCEQPGEGRESSR